MMTFNVIFVLMIQCAAEVAVRSAPEELGPTTRKAALPAPGTGVRNHEDWSKAGSLSYQVLKQALMDPFALCCVLLLTAYALFNQINPPVKAAADDASGTSSSSKARPRRGPDRFALVVNQKLTRLDTVDEVLDFILASSSTGRTDIVNCVTAVHRSAKLVAGKPQLDRIRVGQDPRLRQLLGQLQAFLQDQHPPAIVSRAVGNTSWALAKLQYRQDQDDTDVLSTLQRLFVAHAADFKPEELMNTVWAFGELRREKDGDAEQAVEIAAAACKCLHKFDQFTLQQVVYFSWALARLSSIGAVKNDAAEVRRGLLAYTSKIVSRTGPSLCQLNPKNLAMLSWALASLHGNMGLVDEGGVVALLGDIASLLERSGLNHFQPGELASILWAVNKAHVSAPKFYALIGAHIRRHGLRGFNTQDVSTILCAFVKTGSGDDALYNLIADKARLHARDFNRSEKMMVQWAFNQLPHLAAPEL